MEVAVVPGEDQDEDVRREVRQEIDWSVIVGSVIWGGCHHIHVHHVGRKWTPHPSIGVMGGLRGVNVNRVARSLSIVTARMGGLPDV